MAELIVAYARSEHTNDLLHLRFRGPRQQPAGHSFVFDQRFRWMEVGHAQILAYRPSLVRAVTHITLRSRGVRITRAGELADQGARGGVTALTSFCSSRSSRSIATSPAANSPRARSRRFVLPNSIAACSMRNHASRKLRQILKSNSIASRSLTLRRRSFAMSIRRQTERWPTQAVQPSTPIHECASRTR
jgi:hypothetical protein